MEGGGEGEIEVLDRGFGRYEALDKILAAIKSLMKYHQSSPIGMRQRSFLSVCSLMIMTHSMSSLFLITSKGSRRRLLHWAMAGLNFWLTAISPHPAKNRIHNFHKLGCHEEQLFHTSGISIAI